MTLSSQRTILGAVGRRSVLSAGLFAGTGCLAMADRNPKHVVVLGAGMAGLYAAWQLQQSGCTVTVYEAQDRIGGRNWTLRKGDLVPDTSTLAQACNFSGGQYFNAGAWRVMPHHRRMMSLAMELGIALMPIHVSQPAMGLYAAGGMDAFPHGMASRLTSGVRTGCQVLRLIPERNNHFSRAVVEYRVGDQTHATQSDAVLVALPLGLVRPLLQRWAPGVESALHQVQSADAIKVAWEAGDDPESGWPVNSMSDQPDQSGLRLIWPHDPVPAVQRVVVAYGNSHALQEVFRGSRVRAVEQAESYLRQFRGFSDLKFLHALAVQWARIPFQRAAAYRLRPESNAALQQLRQGQAPVFFAADGLSSFNGWQEGALESAEAAVQQVSRYLQI